MGARGPRCTRLRTGSDCAGMVLLPDAMVRAVQAGARRAQSRCQQIFPWPVAADGEDPMPGVAGEPGGDVPDPVAECVRVGVAEFLVVTEAQKEVQAGRKVGAMFVAITQPTLTCQVLERAGRYRSATATRPASPTLEPPDCPHPTWRRPSPAAGTSRT